MNCERQGLDGRLYERMASRLRRIGSASGIAGRLKRLAGAIRPAIGENEQKELDEIIAELNLLDEECRREHESLASLIKKKLLETERELERLKTLAEVGELSASVAHEIKNPLCSMGVALEVLEMMIDEDEQVREVVGGIRADLERINKTVENLARLAFNTSPDFREIRLEEVINAGVSTLLPYAGSKDMSIDIELSDPAISLSCDPELIQQVLRNLLMNAVEVGESGGRIVIRGDSLGDEVVISVIDEGPGINKEHIDRIFDPFFTLRDKGMGLGLAICRKIVNAHRGEISAESEPGEGAAFSIRIPARASRDCGGSKPENSCCDTESGDR